MRTLLATLLSAGCGLLLPSLALADHEPRIDVGVGMHAAWYRPVGYQDSFQGIGLSVRHPIDERISFEASGTYFEGPESTVSNPYSVRAYPIQASLIGYMFPHSPFQFYGVAGVGLEGSDVFDEVADKSYHYNRPGGHMGFGGQFNAGRLTFEADWRWILYGSTGTNDSATTPPSPFTNRDARLFRLGMSLYF